MLLIPQCLCIGTRQVQGVLASVDENGHLAIGPVNVEAGQQRLVVAEPEHLGKRDVLAAPDEPPASGWVEARKQREVALEAHDPLDLILAHAMVGPLLLVPFIHVVAHIF